MRKLILAGVLVFATSGVAIFVAAPRGTTPTSSSTNVTGALTDAVATAAPTSSIAGHAGIQSSSRSIDDPTDALSPHATTRPTRRTPPARHGGSGSRFGGASGSGSGSVYVSTPPAPRTGGSPPRSCSGVRVGSGADIQSAIDAHGSGTTFCLSGTYHASSLDPKSNDAFVGPAALDGQSSAQHAFESSADGVTLNGLEVRNYVPSQEDGAVHIDGDGWTVENAYIHNNSAAGIVWTGNATHVVNNRLLSNGEEGFASTGDTNTLFSGNEVGGNNTSHQDWSNEAGGGKFYKSTNLTVRNNYSHDNDGPGLWCDTNCYNALFEGNLLKNNHAAGIDYEISYNATIRNNNFSGNGTYHSSSPYYGSAAILIETSQNVQVYGNVSTHDGNGIALLEESRGSGNRGTYMVQNVSVHDNAVRSPLKQAAGLWNETSDTSYWSSRGNSFSHNSYSAPSGSRAFSWNDSDLSWSGWQSAGQDRTGSYSAT